MAYTAYIKGLAGRLATCVARSKGSSDEEPASAPGAHSRRALLAIGLLELWYEAAPLNRNCCCYCGCGLDSSFGSGLVIEGETRESLSGAATRRAASSRASYTAG
jgi:hypothetical protein